LGMMLVYLILEDLDKNIVLYITFPHKNY